MLAWAGHLARLPRDRPASTAWQATSLRSWRLAQARRAQYGEGPRYHTYRQGRREGRLEHLWQWWLRSRLRHEWPPERPQPRSWADLAQDRTAWQAIARAWVAWCEGSPEAP